MRQLTSQEVSNLTMTKAWVSKRNNVAIYGTGKKTVMLAHGFGCDQRMWRFILPALSEKYTVVLFDYVGSGKSDLSAFSVEKYASLEGYAQDTIDIINSLKLENVAFVGHSVSSMIGLIASLNSPGAIQELLMVCPSPCFLNDLPDYRGGFEHSDLLELMSLMDKNYIGWANYLAPLVMGANSSAALVGELSGSFCSTDPVVAKAFAKATFFSDHRSLIPMSKSRTLVLQSSSDSLASVAIGQYLQQRTPNSELQIIKAEGHCLHMTHPKVTAKSITDFLG